MITPNVGDVCNDDGELCTYNGTEWVSITPTTEQYTLDEVSEEFFGGMCIDDVV